MMECSACCFIVPEKYFSEIMKFQNLFSFNIHLCIVKKTKSINLKIENYEKVDFLMGVFVCFQLGCLGIE